ncbi:unnamed protein product [Toxocara canis]|uniref:Uncharacterized protein n=1 Tax=Toxocara canis TaxID=6265 RepID=A0A3P7H3V5_TOXCA|nr:unnamed protein product [Toxocara canis]
MSMSSLKKTSTLKTLQFFSVFSQHSRQDMTIYASENAEKEVGFVRRLSNEEVLAMIAKRSKKRHRSIISRSPLETNLLELSLLELRSFAETEHWGELEEYGEESLKASIHKEQLSFVLFWTNVNSISQHAFWLWSKASKVLKARYPDISFGAIACHKHSQLCDDNQLSKVDDYHTIFAYRNGKRLAWAKDMRDVNFYLDWVSIVVSGNAVQLESEDELKDARKGKIAPFDDIRPAITIGIFQSESSADFEAFMKVCEILAGRYHFAYFFKNGATNTVFTVRPHEKKKREDFEGGFDAESLIQFVTQSSFPSIDKVYITEYKGHETAKELNEAIAVAESTDPISKHVFLEHFLNTLGMNLEVIGSKDVHPLRYIQLAHVNEVFGAQQITLLPDLQIVDTYFHHDMEQFDDDDDMYGGCPVMSQVHRMRSQIRDEL